MSEEEDFESKVINNTKTFFSQNSELSKNNFDKFLEEVGLLEIFNSEEEKTYIWEVLLKQGPNGILDLDKAIKGVEEIFNPVDEENNGTNDQQGPPEEEKANISNSQPEMAKKHKHKRSVTKFFSQIDIGKIRQLRKVFSLLNLQDKGSVTISQIQDLLSKYKFIKIPLEELVTFLNHICSDDSPSSLSANENHLLTIDFELYSKAMSIMERQLLQTNSDFFTENQNDSDSYEISNDPLEMIEDLMNMEQENNDYIMLLSDIKMSLRECNNSTIENYNKLLSNVQKKNEESLKENISHSNFSFINKLSDLDMFIKDMDTNSKKKIGKLEYFKSSLSILLQNYKNLEDDYKKLFSRMNTNEMPVDDTVDRLLDENNAISKLLDEKANSIEKLQKEIKEKDDNFNKLLLEYNKSDSESKEKTKEINRLMEDNEKLRKNYNQMVNDVLEKIKKDDEDSQKLGIPLDEYKERTQNEKYAIRSISSKMMLNERQKELCKMNYEKLLLYSFNLDLDNQNLLNQFNSLQEKIRTLENSLEATKKTLNEQKQSYFVIKSENTYLQNKNEELTKELETTKMFRPSKALNQLRLSQLRESGTNSMSNMQNIKIVNTKEIKGENGSFSNPFGVDKASLTVKDDLSNAPRLSKMDINGFQFGNKIFAQNNEDNTGMSRMDRDKLVSESTFVVKGINKDKQSITPIAEEDPFSPSHEHSSTFTENMNRQPFEIMKKKTNSSLCEEEVRGSTIIKQTDSNFEQCINTGFNNYNQAQSMSHKNEMVESINSNVPLQYQSTAQSHSMMRENLNLAHLRNQTVDDINQLLPSPTTILNSYDFLTLRKNQIIQKLLDTNSDNSSSYEMFSDNVFLLHDNYKKSKRTIFITCESIYILKPDTYVVKQKFKRELLKKFTISNKNCNMIAFHFTKGDDLVIEILRRLELLYYFRDLYKFKSFGKLAFKYSDEFNIKKSGRYFTMKVYVSNDTVAQNFQNAEKLDYLYKMTEGFFSYSFNEKLVVLTNIGLLYFDDPTKPPKKLIAIVGSEINKCEEKKYGRKFCFEIRTLNKEHIVFAAKTEEDLNDWINAFNRMKEQYENKLSAIDEGKEKKK